MSLSDLINIAICLYLLLSLAIILIRTVSREDSRLISGVSFVIILLPWVYPLVGFPLLLIIFVIRPKLPIYSPITIYNAIKNFSDDSNRLGRTVSNQQIIDKILPSDPNFSLPIFREFFVSLYSQALNEMATKEFATSRPYLSSQAISSLLKRSTDLDEVREVIVGAMWLTDFNANDAQQSIIVGLEANHIEVQDGKEQAFVTRESWTLVRKAGLTSKPPKPVSVLSCPSCGYTGDIPSDGKCPHCNHSNAHGAYDWVVRAITITHSEKFTPYEAVVSGVEAGTQLKTSKDPLLKLTKEEFMTRHPDFSWDSFWAKTSGIFLKLQEGWSKRKPELCRPHETDVVFRMHRFGIEDLIRRGRTNKLSDIKIEHWVLAKIGLDAYYESITARVFVSMIDITIDDNGKLVSGNPDNPTKFSEYWTFIRRIGGKAAKADSLVACPSCGGPLEGINQAGKCEYCGSIVTLGDFDWVLSNIEQDDIYQS